MLTGRQQEIWDFLVDYVDGHGYPPTVREIGEAVGLASPSTVHAHLANLERAGLLRRDPTKPRALELIGRERSGASRPTPETHLLPVLGQIAGDQVMALFVPGLSGSDYARKAVAAAAALLDAVGYRTPAGPWLEIGVGIASGDEFCGNVGGGGFKDFTAVGDVTNTAARLTARAAAGEAIVDAATRAAATAFSFSGSEFVMLKGKASPVEIYRLTHDSA